MTKLTLSLLLLVVTVANGQQQLEKSFKLGDLAYVESSEPCGWICFDRGVQVEREGKRCYLHLEREGNFKLAALSKTIVGEVLAYYTIKVGEGDVPGPTPDPVIDDNVPNVIGVGKPAYVEAKALSDKATAEALYRIWGNAANKMQAIDVGLEYNKRADAMDAVWSEVKTQSDQFCSAKWKPWRDARQTAIQALENAGKLAGPAEHAAVMQEVSVAMRILARGK